MATAEITTQDILGFLNHCEKMEQNMLDGCVEMGRSAAVCGDLRRKVAMYRAAQEHIVRVFIKEGNPGEVIALPCHMFPESLLVQLRETELGDGPEPPGAA